MNKQEILKLNTLSEEEQMYLLRENDILEPNPINNESLADCAFRLRKEIVEEDFSIMDIAQKEVWEECGGELMYGYDDWFCLYAGPIAWIQAALLAKLEGEK